MGRFSGYLFLSDFDFSLTGRGGFIPQANLDAIKEFMDEGGLFAVATGRSIPLFRDRTREFEHNAPCILCNGVAAYDYHSETLFFETPFDDGVQTFLEEVQARFPMFHYELQSAGMHYYYSMTKPREKFCTELHCPLRHISRGDSVQDSIHLAFIGASFLDPKQSAYFGALIGENTDHDYEACKSYIEANSPYRPVRSLPHIMEFMPVGATKGTAAHRLKEELHCHTLVALGDARNDIELIRAADIAFMPSDGMQDVLKAARPDIRVTYACSDGAMAGAVSELRKI